MCYLIFPISGEVTEHQRSDVISSHLKTRLYEHICFAIDQLKGMIYPHSGWNNPDDEKRIHLLYLAQKNEQVKINILAKVPRKWSDI